MLWVDDAILEVTVTADLMSTPVSMPENFSKADKTLVPHSPPKNSYSKSPTSVKNPAQFRKSILRVSQKRLSHSTTFSFHCKQNDLILYSWAKLRTK